MADERTISIVGLPGSGKTTFLAALWDGVSRPVSPDQLTLESLPEERKYLTEIHERWLSCKPTPYTRQGQGVTSLRLSLRAGDQPPFELVIPDIAGEAFNELWEKRSWSDGLRDISAAAGGLLVFIHAGDIVTMHPLVIEAELPAEHATEAEEDAEAPIPWDPATAPTQIKVIDLIQSITGLHGPSTPPLAIVLSAWDTAESEGVEPAEFLAMKMPMLAQYLKANSRMEHHIFGLSAQGGDVEADDEAERLRKIAPPAARVKVVDGSSASSEIARPLSWLLERV